MSKTYEKGGDFKIEAFSLVDRCPYCGARWGEAGKMRDGTPCQHPTKMQSGGGFLGVSGSVRRRG